MTSPYEDEGIPDVAVDEDPLDAMEPPHDYPMAVEDYGTTPAEQHEGESLDGRLARERPNVDPYPTDEQQSRLVAPDEGAHSDTEKDLIATDVGPDLGGFSAEEAAVHVEPER